MRTRADTSLWHPFAGHGLRERQRAGDQPRRGSLALGRGGNRYLDGSASLWYCNVGHGRTEIADAAAEQLRTLEARSIFGDAATPPALELAERIASLSSLDEAKIFFTSGGGDAVDTAAKLVRLYWQVLGEPERLHIVSLDGRVSRHDGVRDVARRYRGEPRGVPATRSEHLPGAVGFAGRAQERQIERLGPERVAGLLRRGAGDRRRRRVRLLRRDTSRQRPRSAATRACCSSATRSSAVSAGSGSWLGFERFGVEPDLVTFAKGVTSGYLPLGGVVVSGRVADPFWSEPGRVTVRHGQTYSGHAAVCAAALANIAILEREELIPRGQELEDELLSTLAPLASHQLVSQVRGGTGLARRHRIRAGRTGRRSRPALEGVHIHPLAGRHPARARAVSRSLTAPSTISSKEIQLIHDAVRVGLDALVDELVHTA